MACIDKGDEEKKPAAKKSNYLVEKNRASGKDGFARSVASSGAKQSVRASDFPQIFLIPSKLILYRFLLYPN